MPLEPVHNEPALLDSSSKTLIVADLHIGIEYEMFTAGARIPGKTGELCQKLLKLIKGNKVETLVVLGDLKHNLPVSSFQEIREVPEFLNKILTEVDAVHLVPGNHDGGLARLVPEGVVLHPSRGAVINGTGFWHGHTWPYDEVIASKLCVFAHSHPVIVFVDGVGTRSTERCWLRGRWDKKAASVRYDSVGKELVVVPAFSELCGGSYVNEERPRLLGPVMKNRLVDLKNAHIYLLDGTHVGKVNDNMVKVERRFHRSK